MPEERSQLAYPPDSTTEAVFRDLLKKTLPFEIMDILWRRIFYLFSFFESRDGYDALIPGTGNISIDGSDLLLETDTASVSSTSVASNPLRQRILRWDRRQKIKFGAYVDQVTDTAQRSLFVVGAPDTTHYGFEIIGPILRGRTTIRAVAATKVDLDTAVVAASTYVLEAESLPGSQILFSATDTNGIVRSRGVLTSNLASGDTAPVHTNFIHIGVNSTAVGKSFGTRTKYYEYIQER